jgi:hypothetical protein
MMRDIPDYKEAINPNTIKDKDVRNVYNAAYKNEQGITQDLANIIDKNGGTMYKAEYRMKTPGSIESKTLRDRAKDPTLAPMSDADIVGGFSDLIRYTQTGAPETLVEQMTNTLSTLESRGYKINTIKNYFTNKNSTFRSVNAQLTSPTGQKFEIQFNTPKNLDLKAEDDKFYRIVGEKDVLLENGMNKYTKSEVDAAKAKQIEISKRFELPYGIDEFNDKNYKYKFQ